MELIGSFSKSFASRSLQWVHYFLEDKCKEMDAGKVDLEKFVITKGLTKDPKEMPLSNVKRLVRTIQMPRISRTSRWPCASSLVESQSASHSFLKSSLW